jgi:hypothetical protein
MAVADLYLEVIWKFILYIVHGVHSSKIEIFDGMSETVRSRRSCSVAAAIPPGRLEDPPKPLVLLRGASPRQRHHTSRSPPDLDQD